MHNYWFFQWKEGCEFFWTLYGNYVYVITSFSFTYDSIRKCKKKNQNRDFKMSFTPLRSTLTYSSSNSVTCFDDCFLCILERQVRCGLPLSRNLSPDTISRLLYQWWIKYFISLDDRSILLCLAKMAAAGTTEPNEAASQYCRIRRKACNIFKAIVDRNWPLIDR